MDRWMDDIRGHMDLLEWGLGTPRIMISHQQHLSRVLGKKPWGGLPWNLVGRELPQHQGRRGPCQQVARILRLETLALIWNILRDN